VIEKNMRMIAVGVAYATSKNQVWREFSLEEGATIKDVIIKSGILDEFPEINLEQQKVGVFGEIKPLDSPAQDGDRVEIYRPILIDPQKLGRKRYRLRDIRPVIAKKREPSTRS